MVTVVMRTVVGDVGSVVELLVVVACVEVDVVGVVIVDQFSVVVAGVEVDVVGVVVDQFSVVVGELVAMGTLLVIAHTAQHSTLIS